MKGRAAPTRAATQTTQRSYTIYRGAGPHRRVSSSVLGARFLGRLAPRDSLHRMDCPPGRLPTRRTSYPPTRSRLSVYGGSTSRARGNRPQRFLHLLDHGCPTRRNAFRHRLPARSHLSLAHMVFTSAPAEGSTNCTPSRVFAAATTSQMPAHSAASRPPQLRPDRWSFRICAGSGHPIWMQYSRRPSPARAAAPDAASGNAPICNQNYQPPSPGAHRSGLLFAAPAGCSAWFASGLRSESSHDPGVSVRQRQSLLPNRSHQ